MPRLRHAAVLAATVLLLACGDGDREDVDAGRTPDASTGGGQAPVISRVAWMRVGPCAPGTASDYLVTASFGDPDTPNDQLTLSGGVSTCTPDPFGGNPQLIRCRNLAPHPGAITVTDPQDNRDTLSFTLGICQDGMVNR